MQIAELPVAREGVFDPPADYARLREEAPIVGVGGADGQTVWLVSGFDLVNELHADKRLSSDVRSAHYPHNSPQLAANADRLYSFVFMDGEDHDVIRRQLSKHFTVKRAEDFRPRVQRIVDELVDELLEAGPPQDLVQRFAESVPSRTICDFLGVPAEDRDKFQHWAHAVIDPKTPVEDSMKAAEQFHAYMDVIVKAREENPRDDVISALIADSWQTGKMSHDAVVRNIRLLIGSGHGTTGSLITQSILVLLSNPDAAEKIRANEDPRVLVAAGNELIRYCGILHHGTRRWAKEDMEVAGSRIKAGDGIIMVIASAERDERHYTHADELDLTRASGRSISFGNGIHQCLGQHLARVELQCAVSTLFKRIPTARLNAELSELDFKIHDATYGVYELPATW